MESLIGKRFLSGPGLGGREKRRPWVVAGRVQIEPDPQRTNAFDDVDGAGSSLERASRPGGCREHEPGAVEAVEFDGAHT